MPEHRQPEGRLRDEDVARHKLEPGASRIGNILVISRGHHTEAAAFHPDLRGAENVAGRVETHPRVVELQVLAIADNLRAAGKTFAIAQTHDVKRLLSRQHRAMTCASVVGMTVRNEGSLDGPDRIDMEGAGSAANARWSRYQDIFDAHAF